MRSIWVTLTFLVFVCVTTGAPVADNQRRGLDLPVVGDVASHADVKASPSAAAVDVGSAGTDVRVKANAKILRPGSPVVGASLSPRNPQDLTSLLSGLLPSLGSEPQPAMNAPAPRSPQILGGVLQGLGGVLHHSNSQEGSPTPTRQPQANSPASTSPQQPQLDVPVPSLPALSALTPASQSQGNNILPRDPQDLSKVLGIVFPSNPAPEPRSDDKEASDSSDTSLASREPQIDKVLGIVTGAVVAPPPPPDSDTSRRWLVDTQVASEESANVDTDSVMIPRQFGHADHHDPHGHHDNHDHHGPPHHPVHHGPPEHHDHHGPPHHPIHHGPPEHHEHHGPPHHPVHHGPPGHHDHRGVPEHHDHHDHHAPHGVVIVGGGHHAPAASIHLGPAGLKISAHKG